MIYTNNNTLSLSQVNGFKVQMQASNPRHLMNDLTEAGKANVSPADKSVSSFGEAMTQAVKKVNQAQHTADAKVNQWAINPESIDIHDVTIAMAKAESSLMLMKTVTDKITMAYRDLSMMR